MIPETTGESDTTVERPRLARRLWRTRGSWVVLLCVLVVLVFFVRSSWTYGKTLDPKPETFAYGDYHNLIADAFLEGQVSLTLEVPFGLTVLEDPYDPAANAPYRGQGLHDLSFYDGKLYAYFGPAPAVLAYIPFRIFNVGVLSSTLVALVFCSLGFLFSYLLFRLLVQYCCGGVGRWHHCAAVLALGLGGPVAWTIYRGRSYEVSIAVGYALLFAGMYLLARGVLTGRGIGWVVLGSAALGLAVASRPVLVVATTAFAVIAGVLIVRQGAREERSRFLIALAVPYLLIGALLGLYNYVRFDSLFEFGQSYQLAGANLRKHPFTRFSADPDGLYRYLFAPPRVSRVYPYLYLPNDEPVAGAITSMPVNLVGVVLAALAVPRLRAEKTKAALTLVSILGPAVLLILVLSFYFAYANFRYELDFVPLLTLASVLGWTVWSRTPDRSRWASSLGHGVFLVALTGSVAFNLAITFTLCSATSTC